MGLVYVKISEGNSAAKKVQSRSKICMCVQGESRTDVRVIREATALVAAGYSVVIVDLLKESNGLAEEDINNVWVRHIFMPHWFMPTRFKPWFFVKQIQLLVRTTYLLVKESADAYHAHDTETLLPCYIASILRRKPLIFDAHEFPLVQGDSSEMILKRLWRYLTSAITLALVLPSCQQIITVSSQLAQEIQKIYPGTEITIVRNILAYRSVTKGDRLHQYLNLSSEVHIVLYQGNIQADRGLDNLVRAAKFLKQDIVIVMMGKASETTLSALKALIIHEDVADQVKILPPVPYVELLEWTASADIGIVVNPPDHSLNVRFCLPNKVFEYLMAGLPVLSSQLVAVADIIETYCCGHILPSLAPEEIAKAINMMLADSASLARMRQKALEATRQELNWEKESKKLVCLYQTILK